MTCRANAGKEAASFRLAPARGNATAGKEDRGGTAEQEAH